MPLSIHVHTHVHTHVSLWSHLDLHGPCCVLGACGLWWWAMGTPPVFRGPHVRLSSVNTTSIGSLSIRAQ